MPWIPQGNDNLAYWCSLLDLPVVAIAGMDRERTVQAMQCGAAGVALISGITAAPSPEDMIASLQHAVRQGRELPKQHPPALPRSTLGR
jgi:thiamine monophosphate synthase